MAAQTKMSVMVFAIAIASCTTPPPPREAPAAAAPPAPAAATKPPETKPLAPASAAVVAANCFTCHGPAGRSPGSIPSINALGAADIATALKQFKSGERPATVMDRHAKGYSDAEIEAVAGYIAGVNKK